jgi:AcrR family transcriptional regulator
MTSATKPGGDRETRSALSRTLITSELLDKATALFAEKGYETTTLQDIANALGVSRSALYHYVSSKEDLLTMLVEQVSLGLAEVIEELARRRDLSARRKLANVVSLMVRQRAEHPDQFRILDRSETVLPEPARSRHLAARRKVLRELVNVIAAGTEAGEFRRVDPRTAALSVLGMCNWVAWWFRPGSDVEPVVTAVTDLAAAMLAADGEAVRNAETSRTVDEIRALLDRLDRR